METDVLPPTTNECVEYCNRIALPLLRDAYAYYCRLTPTHSLVSEYSVEAPYDETEATSYEYNEKLYEAARLLSLHAVDELYDWRHYCDLQQYGYESETHGYRTTEFDYVRDSTTNHRADDLRHYLVTTARLVRLFRSDSELPHGILLEATVTTTATEAPSYELLSP